VLSLVSFLSSAQATTIIENAEDGTINGWSVRSDSSEDASVDNIFDEESQSRVIRFRGNGTRDSYILGRQSGAGAWNYTNDKMLTWKMKFDESFVFYVSVQTTFGHRYLFYPVTNSRWLFHGPRDGIHHGLGVYNRDGEWTRITRDLERDLKDAEPENELLSVNAFIVRGSGMIDDLILYSSEDIVYEDGESGVDGWSVSDATPAGATITNVPDNDAQGRNLQGNVIQLNGDGLNNQYMLGSNSGDGAWNNTVNSIIQWRFRYAEAFEVRIGAQTANGPRDFVYRMGWQRGHIDNGQGIIHGLGNDHIIGVVYERPDQNEPNLWQGVQRDLAEDLKDVEPNNQLLSVNSFSIRGSGFVDDIKMRSSANVPLIVSRKFGRVYEDAEDGTIDGWRIYDATPAGATIANVVDSSHGGRVIELSGDGYNNGFILGDRDGLRAWQNTENTIIRWSMNFNSGFAIYIPIMTTNGQRYMVYSPSSTDRGLSGEYIRIGLGADARNGTWQTVIRDLSADLEHFEPGNELVSINGFMVRGSGRIDNIETLVVMPEEEDEIVYEDAEDGNIEGWSIYDNTPEGAVIANIEDPTRGGRVIELSGDRYNNGYILGGRNSTSGWNNTTHQQLRWSMNYSEGFAIYIPIDTTNGQRYLVYSPHNADRGISGQYIRLGLGANARNGTWQTFTRDIAQDLQRFEPNNQLQSINGFMVRGSGRIDDIGLLN